MQFVKVEEIAFDEVYKQMEDSFPVCERRSYKEAKAVLNNKDYTLYHIEESCKRIGFISVWQLEGFTFVEHFAIYSQFRNLGYGAKAIGLAKECWQTLVLEAEPPTCEIASRRLAFYERNGFLQNPFKYKQPAYREGEEDVELVVMSCPSLLNDGKKVVKEIYARVYGR